MSYTRVIPRDLFNEAKLLKCLGKLIILAESTPGLTITHDGEPFYIQRDPASGDISCINVEVCNSAGVIPCWTPLNSRDDWPLKAMGNGEDVDVFNYYGEAFTPEFLKLIQP